MPAAIWPRICTKCGEDDIGKLVKGKEYPGGVQTICRACHRVLWRKTPSAKKDRTAARRAWRVANPERNRENVRRYRQQRRKNKPAAWVAIGKAVLAWRHRHGISAAQLGELLKISPATVSRRESALFPWPLDALDKLQRAGAVFDDLDLSCMRAHWAARGLKVAA
jgi:ribosome-binding protein aMBF1 (putative translation factor)